MKYLLLILVSIFVVAGCSENSGPTEAETWTAETLHSGMEISFPSNYVGEGVWCGMDACWFIKNRIDGEVAFYISVWGMTGGLPEHFEAMPDQFRYPERELLETNSGISGAFFYEREGVTDPDDCRGVFVVEMNGGGEFVEAVRVNYPRVERRQIKEILRTIQFNR